MPQPVAQRLPTGHEQDVITPLQRKWNALDRQATAEGWSLQDYLGAAVGTPQAAGTGATIQTYERGAIVVRGVGAFVVSGRIYARYVQLGGPSGLLGLPKSDEQAAPGGGRFSAFDGGDIYWSAATNAREVHGAIRDRWLALGGAGGVLGYPTSDECPVLRNGTEIGRSHLFQNGAMYWTAATGAWDVYGAIADCYRTYGGPTGAFGFPTSGETSTPDPGGRFNEFQSGIIVWRPDGPYAGARPVFDLCVSLTNFESDWGSYHVQTKIDASNPTLTSDVWYPSTDDYTSNPAVNAKVLTVPVTRATTAIDVWMDALGQHNLGVGADERLGKVQLHYDITNLWGLVDTLANPRQDANVDLDDGHHFAAYYTITTDLPIDPNRSFRTTYFWPFGNPNTPVLSDTTYAQTFSDVHEDESALWHPFDQVFYTFVYKGIGKHGDCFGTCLEALYALAGRSLFPEPIYDDPYIAYSDQLKAGASPVAPGDSRFLDQINIKHGYQLGIDVVNDFLERFVSGDLNDAAAAYDQSFAAFQRGEHGILSVSQDGTLGSSGHAVVPYSWNAKGDALTIGIANPNAPASKYGDGDPANVITISRSAKTFSFVMAYDGSSNTPNRWSGGPGGGRIFFLPFSLLSVEPATPYADLEALIEGATFIVMGGGSETVQVTDEQGRSLFAPPAAHGIQRIPGSNPDLERTVSGLPPTVARAPVADPAKRIPNLVLVPPINGPTPANGSPPIQAERTETGGVSGLPQLASTVPPELYYLRRPPAFKTAAAASGSQAQGAVTQGTQSNREMETINHGPVEKPLIGEQVTLTWEVASSRAQAYTWAMRGPYGAAVATVPGTNTANDVITLQHDAKAPATVALAVKAGAPAKTASLVLTGPARGGAASTRIFEVGGIPMTPGGGIGLRLEDGGGTLVVDNPGVAVGLSVAMRSGSDPGTASRPAVSIAANALLRIAPADWTPASLAKTAVVLQHIDRSNGAVVAKEQI